MDIILEEVGDALLSILAGGAVIVMFMAVLEYATSF